MELAKHVLHVICLCSWTVFMVLFWRNVEITTESDESFGYTILVLVYVLRAIILLGLPQCVCNMLGLVLYNAFPDRVQLKSSPLLCPLICFRVVTRGDYPDLVRRNIAINLAKCHNVNLVNYYFEVVTDTAIGRLEGDQRVRELVVPVTYKTKTGALYKARALQYCLENGVNTLPDDAWIVHLDEETLLTENGIYGIMNFCTDDQHSFGQGVINYANGTIVNWLTTLSDSFRVADDFGKLQFQLRAWMRPVFGWKGSFVVAKACAERNVSYDHGREGSIAEDCFFGMIGIRDGYSTGFIQGEMNEKSPFTVSDYLRQRQRWLQGIFLTAHSKKIPWHCKFLLTLSVYAWITMPLATLHPLLDFVIRMPNSVLFEGILAFTLAANIYLYVFGAIKSFSSRTVNSPFSIVFYVIGALLSIPFSICIQNAAVFCGLFSQMNGFHVVQKQMEITEPRRKTEIAHFVGWLLRRTVGRLTGLPTAIIPLFGFARNQRRRHHSVSELYYVEL